MSDEKAITINGRRLKVGIGVVAGLLGFISLGLIHLVWANTGAINGLERQQAVQDTRWEYIREELVELKEGQKEITRELKRR